MDVYGFYNDLEEVEWLGVEELELLMLRVGSLRDLNEGYWKNAQEGKEKKGKRSVFLIWRTPFS